MTQAIQSIIQTNTRCRLPFTRWSGGDGGYQNELAVVCCVIQVNLSKVNFCLVMTEWNQ